MPSGHRETSTLALTRHEGSSIDHSPTHAAVFVDSTARRFGGSHSLATPFSLTKIQRLACRGFVDTLSAECQLSERVNRTRFIYSLSETFVYHVVKRGRAVQSVVTLKRCAACMLR